MNIRAILEGLPSTSAPAAGADARPHGCYPRTRLRRMRGDDWSRRLMRETQISANDLIWPIFVQDGDVAQTPVPSMPGVMRYSVAQAVTAVGAAAELGIPAIAVFPVVDPKLKSEDGREAANGDNIVCRAVRAIKAAHPHVGIICDAALDPFTSHGQDGLLKDGVVINDETVAALAQQSLAQARAGCDVIAPSDMMDGRVGAIRDALDAEGFDYVKILAYSAKYASAFYGPFRDAVGSGTALGVKGKQTYQMDPANGDEALRETALDIAEGADMVMVKPGLPYLDVLWRVKEAFKLPTFAYHVSGEYAMLKAAAANGWLDGDKALMEALTCFKRAGADGILTYGALDAAKILRSGV